jgi:hypothetical protein
MLLLFPASARRHAQNGTAWWRWRFLFKIRAELPPSVEKSGG